MMSELKVMEREDRTRRQKAIAAMPVRTKEYQGLIMYRGLRVYIPRACILDWGLYQGLVYRGLTVCTKGLIPRMH